MKLLCKRKRDTTMLLVVGNETMALVWHRFVLSLSCLLVVGKRVGRVTALILGNERRTTALLVISHHTAVFVLSCFVI